MPRLGQVIAEGGHNRDEDVGDGVVIDFVWNRHLRDEEDGVGQQ